MSAGRRRYVYGHGYPLGSMGEALIAAQLKPDEYRESIKCECDDCGGPRMLTALPLSALIDPSYVAALPTGRPR